MMGFVRTFMVALGVGWVLVACARDEARVEVTELTMPTYGFSDPDPVPDIDARHYPYFRFDGSAHASQPRNWRAVILENERIRVTILPEIGGKIWGATDKLSDIDWPDWHQINRRLTAAENPDSCFKLRSVWLSLPLRRMETADGR